jgi:hypothetical protein
MKGVIEANHVLQRLTVSLRLLKKIFFEPIYESRYPDSKKGTQ